MINDNPIYLEGQIRERMNLSPDAIRAAACDGQIERHVDQLISFVKVLEHTYVQDRVYDEARGLRATYENVKPSEEWAEAYRNDDGGWRKGIWNELFPPRRGAQGHDTLLMIYDCLSEFWLELPPDIPSSPRKREHSAVRRRVAANTRKRSSRWAPVYKRDWVERKIDVRPARSYPNLILELIPANPAAKLFLSVAKLFDPSYTAKNCGATADRAKNLRRRPDGLAKLRERRRRAAAKFRAKHPD